LVRIRFGGFLGGLLFEPDGPAWFTHDPLFGVAGVLFAQFDADVIMP
jgi:hypothetical protein